MSIPAALAVPPVKWVLLVVVTIHGQPSDVSVFAEFDTREACTRAFALLAHQSRTTHVSTCKAEGERL